MNLAAVGRAILLLSAAVAVEAPPAPTLDLVTAAEPGTRLVLTVTVVDGDNRPIAGADVHVYQTDASGAYTRERPMDEPHARLAGRATTDVLGRIALHTIRPGGYPRALRLGDRDRRIPAHIHLDVAARGFAERRLQAVFADDPLLADPYWQDWVRRLGQPVLAVDGSSGVGTASLRIVLRSAPETR